MNEHRTTSFIGRSKLVLFFIVPVLFLINLPGGAGAVPPSPDGPGFRTIQLPESARFAPAGLPVGGGTAGNPKLDSTMAGLAAAAKTAAADAVDLAKTESLRLSGDRVQVQIVTHAAGLAQVVKAVAQAGGEVTGVANQDTLVQGWLPVGALESVAAQSDVYRIRRPAEAVELEHLAVGASTTEGVAAINASAWHAAGYRGAGVKIGIIDGGFQGYPTLLGGDLPASVTVKNFVDGETDAQVNGSSVHGTACAEIIHDIAPNATLYLAKIGTDVDLAEAVAWLKDTHHVNIISTSLGWYNLTPGDGTGEFANLVSQARAAGILWLTAASNDREAHWGGAYSDPDSDGSHNFNGTQEVDYFGPGDGNAYLIPAGYVFSVFLRWDDWTNVNQNYNLFLVRWNGSSWVTVASSQNAQNGGVGQTPTEYAAVLTSGSDAPYGFYIQRVSSSRNVNFEVFAPKMARLDELVHARSLANLADAPSAMTVAALDVNSPYPQESYSSEGPTNGAGGTAAGGAVKPDIAGFANVSTQSYGSGADKFNGTSSATPHVAGAAALVLDANPGYTPSQIQSFLQGRAVDMGIAGKDTLFGYGRLNLGAAPPPPVDTNFKLYLPALSKPVPPPPAGPTPGFWESTTGDEFYVTPDRANVDDFAIYISVDPCGDYKITHTPLVPISNNHFAFTGPFYGSGTFNTSTTASGTDGLTNFYIDGCGTVNGGPWNYSAVWKNNSQPSFMPATVVGTDAVTSAPASDSYYTVTRLK